MIPHINALSLTALAMLRITGLKKGEKYDKRTKSIVSRDRIAAS